MNLERAIQIAAEAHAGQRDKAGEAYILHPLRVMLSVTGEDARIVAVLHDVVEDCKEKGWTFERLREERMPQHLLDALASVTKLEEKEDYLKFVERAGRNKIGRVVKIADLKDNLDLCRISSPTERDYKRLEQYRQALQFLDAFPAKPTTSPNSTSQEPSKPDPWMDLGDFSEGETKAAREARDERLPLDGRPMRSASNVARYPETDSGGDPVATQREER